MPRNSRVTRILCVLRRLEAPQGATLQEPAAALPEDAPKHPRTLRRDLEALESLGFPVSPERADGQVRWKLLEGFRRIPAPAFAPTELMVLVFSRQLLTSLEGTEVHAALDGALAKVQQALPPAGMAVLQQLQGLFAVERIRPLTITDRPYQLPLHFDLDAYVRDALMVMRGKPVRVELLFDKATTAWVRDRVWHPSQVATLQKDGRLRLTLNVAETPELVGWVLSFAGGAQVMSPPSLREAVRQAAACIAHDSAVSPGSR